MGSALHVPGFWYRPLRLPGGGWPRFPPDLTPRNDEGLTLLSAPGTLTSSALCPFMGQCVEAGDSEGQKIGVRPGFIPA